MNKSLWQRIQPHAIAILIFLVVSSLFCLPAFRNMILNQSDILAWKSMAQQSFEFKEKYGHFPLWTNSMFSGMPAYQVAIDSDNYISLAYIHSLFTFLPDPASFFFLACVGFYILCSVLGLKPWIGVVGALAYSFATYNAIITVVGHNTKFLSMGYMPAVIGGLILLSQRRYYLGFFTTLLFSFLLIAQNHIQIVYYTLLIAFCMGVAYTIHVIKNKRVKELLPVGGLALIAALLGLAMCAGTMLPTYDYSKESMRGGRSELADVQSRENKTKGGLDKDYAFRWSYGIDETMTFILPAYKGGSSGPAELPQDGKAVQALQDAQLPQNVADYFYGNLSAYWGVQVFGTSGPVYLGVIICLLFIIGLFVVKDWHLGWIVAATMVGLVLAWGSNLKSVNYFLFDHLPLYSKFRAPSMALVIPQFTFAVLACLALQALFYKAWDQKLLFKQLKYAGITVGIIAAVLVFNYFNADFRSETDKDTRQNITDGLSRLLAQGQQPSPQVTQQAGSIATSVMSGLAEDRKSIYGADLLRTFLFMALGVLLIWLGVQKKVRPLYILIALSILLLADLIPVDRRYLNDTHYVDKDEFLSPLEPSQADLQIKQDTGYYRVFDQSSGNPFVNPRCSYHHNSIGGHHPARLGLYEDLITNHLSRGNMRVFNMLNAKYFIANTPEDRKPVAQLNPGALGPCWLVRSIKYVNNAEEEISALNTFNPADTVIIDKREQSKITFLPQFDSSASITLEKNRNDDITYRFNAATNQFAVFSEVYYHSGWKAFIDNQETPIVKVDYALRGLPVPTGKHSITFRFEPASYTNGNRIALAATVISVLLLLFCAWKGWKMNSGK